MMVCSACGDGSEEVPWQAKPSTQQSIGPIQVHDPLTAAAIRWGKARYEFAESEKRNAGPAERAVYMEEVHRSAAILNQVIEKMERPPT